MSDMDNDEIDMVMKSTPEARERFVIRTLLDIKSNGCAKACNPSSGTGKTSAIASGVAAGVLAAYEMIKAVVGK